MDIKIKQKENNSANEYSINKLQGSVNNIFQRGKSTVKIYAEKSLNETKKNMKRKLKGTRKKYQISKIISKNTLKGVKIGALSTFTIVKNAILATKALIATIVAGGWVAVLIIIFLCLISLICSSSFGIFFFK